MNLQPSRRSNGLAVAALHSAAVSASTMQGNDESAIHRLRSMLPSPLSFGPILSRPMKTFLPILALALPLHAQTIFTNDFENDSAGFSSSSRVSLPVDAAGFNSLNASQYLGTFMEESVTLNLTGLTAGATYLVSFDLFIGASWDGRFLCWNQGDRS